VDEEAAPGLEETRRLESVLVKALLLRRRCVVERESGEIGRKEIEEDVTVRPADCISHPYPGQPDC
jgi:hypothetical protein